MPNGNKIDLMLKGTSSPNFLFFDHLKHSLEKKKQVLGFMV